jgi:lantibiotic biosynthesis protein
VTAAGTATAGWHQDLGSGAAGTALARIAAARASGLPPRAIAPWIRAMTAGPVTAAASAASLFYGAPAVAFVLHTAAHPAYAGMIAALDEHVNDLTGLKLAAAHERIQRGELARPSEYDLISGLTGLGLYHLVRHGPRGLRDDGRRTRIPRRARRTGLPERRVPARMVERHWLRRRA